MFVTGIAALIELALTVLAFGLEAFALVDAAITRGDAFYAAGKLTKNKWLGILALSVCMGLLSLAGRLDLLTSLLPLLGVVASAVYLVDVRPAVRQFRGGRGSGSGPYGPW